jgi:hypothetical protein
MMSIFSAMFSPFNWKRSFKRMLKNAPAYRQASICPALRGIALILALLDEQIDFG